MELGFITLSILMVLFALLGMYDGIYLHIFKYRLYQHQESKFEHLTHTVRAVLFPLILFFLYLQDSPAGFYAGLSFVALDVLTLGIDAYMEKDSRTFMGGLPRWEYILHLFVNGFHFAALAVFLVVKVEVVNESFALISSFKTVSSYSTFVWLIQNMIPGAILTAGLHVLVGYRPTAILWHEMLKRVTCC